MAATMLGLAPIRDRVASEVDRTFRNVLRNGCQIHAAANPFSGPCGINDSLPAQFRQVRFHRAISGNGTVVVGLGGGFSLLRRVPCQRSKNVRSFWRFCSPPVMSAACLHSSHPLVDCIINMFGYRVFGKHNPAQDLIRRDRLIRLSFRTI